MSELPTIPQWPSARMMGAEYLGYDAETQTVEMAFTLPPEFAAMRGTVQGGLLAGPFDEAFGAALYMATGGKLQLTLDLNLSLLRPVPLERFTIKARAAKAGRRVCFLDADLFDVNGKLAARCTATSMVTDWPQAKGAEAEG
ncbi:PaaI family thioesterase [Aurantiacibacter rhizosphaerae]|uniref:PaaI family thioesterase n=1 Tax=Aurantiacibacter rhizosphaerae TaxID=2691582 RepID=A0A844XCL7_9SPHN|nr:PaaI family thioesterase [Aurantiacibacter rhizosphaerae]MWV27513.1 PaaI family thioesterase [Aurantiacibacter rhizosphaerae]